MTPDLHQTARFLETLDPDADRFTFQYFGEQRGSVVRARHVHARLEDIAATLSRVNTAGAGVFVTVNRTDGRGRSADHITGLRSLFIDCDGRRARALAIPPSMSVETSPGRGHHYWLLAPGDGLDEFRAAQEILAAYYGTDLTVTDLGRVLRLPGFANMKREPFPVRLSVCRPERLYSIAEVLAAHHIHPRARCAVTAPYQPRSCAERAYRRWSCRAPLTVGLRNRTAFRLALEGFRGGLDPVAIAREVHAYCERAGIANEAASVLRSARRTAALPRRRAASGEDTESGSAP